MAWTADATFTDRFVESFRTLALDRSPGQSWYLWATYPLSRPGLDPGLPDRALDRVRPEDRPGTTADQIDLARVYLLLARGRVREAVDLTRRRGASFVTGPLQPFFDAVIAGIADEQTAAPFTGPRPGGPPRGWFDVHFALATGDPARAAALGLDDEADLPEEAPPWAPATLYAVDGWRWVLAGEEEQGVARIREGLRRAGYGPGQRTVLTPLLFHFAVHLARTDAGRDEGIRRLEALLLWTPPTYRAPTHLALAEAYEADGDVAAAARHYSQVVRLWERADPHLQPHVDAARRALQRLGAEG